jgi:hypothetical protein
VFAPLHMIEVASTMIALFRDPQLGASPKACTESLVQN